MKRLMLIALVALAACKEEEAAAPEEAAPAIYIVGSGRINVAGMTEDNVDYLCDAVAAVL